MGVECRQGTDMALSSRRGAFLFLHAQRSKHMAKPIPDGYHTVTPHLVINGAAKALDWYKKAFGAQEIMRKAMPDGRLLSRARPKVTEGAGCYHRHHQPVRSGLRQGLEPGRRRWRYRALPAHG